MRIEITDLNHLHSPLETMRNYTLIIENIKLSESGEEISCEIKRIDIRRFPIHYLGDAWRKMIWQKDSTPKNVWDLLINHIEAQKAVIKFFSEYDIAH